jgi:hypothetical protein
VIPYLHVSRTGIATCISAVVRTYHPDVNAATMRRSRKPMGNQSDQGPDNGSGQDLVVTREALYCLVWAEPMLKVAAGSTRCVVY